MSRGRRAGGILTALLVGAFLVWGVAGGWRRAADYPWRLDWPLLSASVVALCGFYAAWGAGYVGLIELLGGRRVDRRRLAGVWAKSLLGRYVPGNVVMVAGRVVLGREQGVPAAVSIGASVYEQIAMLAAAGIASAAFLVGAGVNGSPALWAVVAIPLGLVLLDPKVFGWVSRRLIRRLGRGEPLIPLSRRGVAAVLAWFGATMALLALGVGLGVRGLAGPAIDSVAFVALGFLLSWAVSMIAFVFPSGLGVREGALALVLGRYLPDAAAVAMAAAARLLVTAVELVCVAAVLGYARGATGAASSRVSTRSITSSPKD